MVVPLSWPPALLAPHMPRAHQASAMAEGAAGGALALVWFVWRGSEASICDVAAVSE